jgi:serine phosphatase RsbU (regulator of sigma subunit)
MTLLVVDPDEASSASLADRLTKLGFAVACVLDSTTARERLPRDPPDLVLVPIGADFSAAITVADAMAAAAPGLPLVLVTAAELSKKELVEAVRHGVVDVLEKCSGAELAGLIEDAVRRGQERRMSTTTANQVARGNEIKLRELQRDQRAGRYIQMGMLPPSPMAVDEYRLQHRIFPSLMLSGDFVDYFRISDRHFVFYIADVSGHGASSAFVTVLLKNFSRRLRREFRPGMLKAPGEILVWLNRELLDNEIDKHVAIFIGVIDPRTNQVAYANGGHFPSAILADEQGARTLELTGKPVGLFRDVTWESRRESLSERFVLVLLSDGVLELMGTMSLAEKEARLLQAVEQCYKTGSEIWQELDLEANQPGPDDMACLMVTRGLS